MRPHAPRPTRPRPRLRARSQAGIVFVWVLMCVLIIAGIVATAVGRMHGMDQLADASFHADGQARQVAAAGLADALAWMRRMPQQPVQYFVPWRDAGAPLPTHLVGVDGVEPPRPSKGDANPPINETEDPDVGLVRTFEIAPGLWGRYSVIRGIPPEKWDDKDKDGLYDEGEKFDDVDKDGVWTPGSWTRDVSQQRGLSGKGTVWRLVSRGQVFERPERHRDLGEGRNRQLASVIVATEIRRMAISLPGQAALLVGRGDGLHLGSHVRVRGASAAAYPKNTGRPVLGDAEVAGTTAPVDPFPHALEDVFGLSWPELAAMADLSTSDAATGLPAQLPDYTLTLVQGNATFDRDRPLRGNGILVVQGDLRLAKGSNSFFHGILYVDGDVDVEAPAYLRGTVLATGRIDVRGSGADYAEVDHDAAVVDEMLQRLGQYRQAKAVYLPMPTLPDGRPNPLVESTRRLSNDPYPAGYTPPIPPPLKSMRKLYKKVSGQ